MHAINQEYVLDKVNKKLHLSKVKHMKFNESGQLLSFYLVSLIWAGDIIYRENLFTLSSLWEGYPHNTMTFMFKFFFIIQISYWLHIFPELYFQKVKKEDMGAKIQYACLYLAFIVPAYMMRFTRVTIILLFIHYLVEGVYHGSRLLAYAERSGVAKKIFKLGDLLFVLARFASVILAVLTYWYGLAKAPVEQQVLDLPTGNFNTGLIRLNCLVAVCLLQAWLMWNFIIFQVQRMREQSAAQMSSAAIAAARAKKTQQERAKARKEKKELKDEDEDELPEVDQDTNKSLRQRVK